MSDDQSWYARKMASLRGGQQPVRQQPASYPQQSQPVAQYQTPPGYSEAPQGQQQASLTQLLDLQRQGHALVPGKGARLNPNPCPNCGGALFFDNLGTKRRGPPPAPRCFNCGYNDLFEQGLESNWQTGA